MVGEQHRAVVRHPNMRSRQPRETKRIAQCGASLVLAAVGLIGVIVLHGKGLLAAF
jgi:hypothetical protein